MDNSPQFNVSLYEEIPTGLEMLHELYGMCTHRLQLFALLKNHEDLKLETMNAELSDNPLRHLLEPELTPAVTTARRIDQYSHWILKILYCDNHPDFFIKCEKRWAKLRFNNLPYDERMQFLKKCDFDAPLVPVEELNAFGLPGTKYYKIFWGEVGELVRRRQVILSHGYAYVPEHKLSFWVAEKLETRLRHDLMYCQTRLSEAVPQLKTLLETLVIVSPFRSRISTDLTYETLDANSRHFPLCMKIQHETLRKKHHLKYHSRVQYGLFLKGLGLSLDDALEMWKDEFVQVMTEKAFDREFPYFFRHQYGLEGSHIDYPAQCCDTIVEQTPSANQIHGCPFKECDSESLRQRLRDDGVDEAILKRIVVAMNEKQYKRGCTLYLGHLSGVRIDGIIDHPITYYEKSRRCRGDAMPDIEDLFISDPTDN